MDDPECVEVADKIYDELVQKFNIECVVDDRNERPGVKFNDSDLIGFPFKVIIGKKGLLEKKVEVKSRKTGEVEFVDFDNISQFVADLVSSKVSL